MVGGSKEWALVLQFYFSILAAKVWNVLWSSPHSHAFIMSCEVLGAEKVFCYQQDTCWLLVVQISPRAATWDALMCTQERGPVAELEMNYLEHRSKIQPGNKSRDQTRGRYTYNIAQARASGPGLSLNGAPPMGGGCVDGAPRLKGQFRTISVLRAPDKRNSQRSTFSSALWQPVMVKIYIKWVQSKDWEVVVDLA